eukprot:g11746.t1
MSGTRRRRVAARAITDWRKAQVGAAFYSLYCWPARYLEAYPDELYACFGGRLVRLGPRLRRRLACGLGGGPGLLEASALLGVPGLAIARGDFLQALFAGGFGRVRLGALLRNGGRIGDVAARVGLLAGQEAAGSGDPTPPACYREGAPLTPNCLAEVVIVSEIMSAFVGRTSLERRLSRLKIGADIGGAAVAKPHGRGFNEAIRAAGVERDIDFYYKIDVWDPQAETYSSRYHNWRKAQVGVTFYTAFCLHPALSRG